MAFLLTDTPATTAVEAAARRLAAGELVAFPTETVYGLGARADDDAAVARIFAAKGRPADHPLIVHVADAAAAQAFAGEMPPVAQRLVAAFWPGPLTVIVPRRPGVATAAAGGQDTVGLRCPAHPVALALLQAAARQGVAGVAGPSANRFGRVSPTTAAHVLAEFATPDVAVLDGGASTVGIESAIVDCSRGRPVLLRPGALTREALAAAAGEPLHDRDEDAPRAAGTLAAHYAPTATVRLMSRSALQQALTVWGETVGQTPKPAGKTLAVYSRGPAGAGMPGVLHHRMPEDAAAAAQELFAVLRAFDEQGAALIWVEEPPPASPWDGVRDRLQRAAAAG